MWKPVRGDTNVWAWLSSRSSTWAPSRVVYGSNFATTSPAAVIARVDNAFLPADQKEAILFRNTQALLEKVGGASNAA